MSTYPKIGEQVLGPVTRKFMRGASRDLSQMPAQRAGSVLVALHGSTAQRVPPASQLRDTDAVIVDASSIVVIDITPGRQVQVPIEIDSKDPGEAFNLIVTFSCTVDEPLQAAMHAPPDITEALQHHLERDQRLLAAGAKHPVTEATEFGVVARTRIKTYCNGHALHFPGISVRLSSVKLVTPSELRDFAGQRRVETYRQELERLRTGFTFEQAKLLEDIIHRGPEALEALYLRLGEQKYADAAGRAYGDRLRLEETLRGLINTFSDRGHFDGLALDTPQLIDTFITLLLNRGDTKALDGDGKRSYVLSGEPSPKAGIGGADGPEELTRPEGLPDEDDDVDD
jgi:hypothetical protein